MNRPAAQPDPPYLRIVTEIRRRIAAGELRAGDRVPSTRQVAREWGVAIATATKALTILRQEGAVQAVPRVGTVVAGPGSPPGPQPGSPPGPQPGAGSGSQPGSGPRSAPRPAPSRPAGPRRTAHDPDQGLTRERIARAAIGIADTEGLDALSMRGVAAKLDVATMSLYRHIRDKEDLVLLMIDTACGEIRYPEEPLTGWRARLELVARLLWSTYRRHPWLAQAGSVTRPLPLPNLMAYAEWTMSAVDGLGLDAETMLNVHVLLYSYVRGIAVNLESEAQAEADTGVTGDEWMDTQEPVLSGQLASGALPTFSRVVADLEDGYDLDLDAIFELGLRAMLDGLGVLIQNSGR
ncbi:MULTISPECIES: TetR/AcrR family transcriptional regulator C-terminal domain-containing protein [Streptosporangium]|uniref:AcrR family transcriptional regulator n=1 Tax=Streptosporangium brasiliense TaxID=47480 RepID=A0ABT9R1L4_9ACTN|nr:TetR/AcrR family transcriptional regulator C-terminal domain-containing protein [Streptosporangium brasiliense]MDP9863102.1 AcrR family transcriptional regulator [Streptosporangium brasiliense]